MTESSHIRKKEIQTELREDKIPIPHSTTGKTTNRQSNKLIDMTLEQAIN